jgi:predicted nucleic acid-binding protein
MNLAALLVTSVFWFAQPQSMAAFLTLRWGYFFCNTMFVVLLALGAWNVWRRRSPAPLRRALIAGVAICAAAAAVLLDTIGAGHRRGARGLVIVTTEHTIAEIEEYLPVFAARYNLDVEVLREALEILPVERYSERDYHSHLAEAHRYLGERDPDDVPLAALALKLQVPVWSNDNDFTELPLDVYPTARFLKMLGL